MRRKYLFCKLSAALVLTSMTLFVGHAHSQQSSATGAERATPQVENGAVRELLRKIQEQQKSLDEQQACLRALIAELQRLLDRGTATNVSITGKPTIPSTSPDVPAP